MPLQHDDAGRFARQYDPWTPERWDEGYVDARGYFRVSRPDYPRAYSNGYAKRYHVVYWLTHGIVPSDEQVIHHIDENTLNDCAENLVLLTQEEHTRIHCGRVGVEFTCDHCGDDFTVPKWRIAQRRKEGTSIRFCSSRCYHAAPRSKSHTDAISRGLRRAYNEGIR